jgi:hypothetical protein
MPAGLANSCKGFPKAYLAANHEGCLPRAGVRTPNLKWCAAVDTMLATDFARFGCLLAWPSNASQVYHRQRGALSDLPSGLTVAARVDPGVEGDNDTSVRGPDDVNRWRRGLADQHFCGGHRE